MQAGTNFGSQNGMLRIFANVDELIIDDQFDKECINMQKLPLTIAMVTYDHTRALKDGAVQSDRVTLSHLEVTPIPRAFRQMVRHLAYDVAEMAFSTYLCARAHDKAITALPIFLLRRFEHGQIVYNVNSGIKSPQDLHDRRVGVRSYTLTPGVWARGILQHAYGVDLSRITWVRSGDEHVAEYVVPPNVIDAPPGADLQSLLLSGEIDAAIGVGQATSAGIQPLIVDAQQAGADFYLQSGIYPISHLVVVKDELLSRYAWLAEELCTMFKTAKHACLTQLDWQDQAINDLQQVIGDDPVPYGIEANRKTLQAFMQFNVEQQIIPTAFEIDALFPSSVLKFA